MTTYQKWLDSIGLNEDLASELTAEEIFNRINSIPIVIDLDHEGQIRHIWTVKQGFGKPVQVHINRHNKTPNFTTSQEIENLI